MSELARNEEDFGAAQSHLNSILDRLNGLGGSASESGTAPLHAVPDLDGEHLDHDDDDGDDASDTYVPQLTLVPEETLDTDETETSETSEETDIEEDETSASDRQTGFLADRLASDEEPETDADSDSLFSGNATDNSFRNKVGAESLPLAAVRPDLDDDEGSASHSKELPRAAKRQEVDAAAEDVTADTDSEVDEPTPQIDYFADLDSGDAPRIAGVDPVRYPTQDEEQTITSDVAVEAEPEAVVPFDLADHQGILVNPLEIKDATPETLDAETFETNHGVAFPASVAGAPGLKGDDSTGNIDQAAAVPDTGVPTLSTRHLVLSVVVVALIALATLMLQDLMKVDGLSSTFRNFIALRF